MLLAKTGVTKAGYLLKKVQSNSSNATNTKSNTAATPLDALSQTMPLTKSQWTSYFIILNDHSLSYCSEKSNFEHPESSLLLTAGTRVYQQDDQVAVIRIETGYEVLLLKGKDEAEMREWKKAIKANVGRLKELARGQFRVRCKGGRVKDCFLMLHR